jgi:hypothetical protein
VLQKPSRHNNFSASDYLLPSFRQGTPALWTTKMPDKVADFITLIRDLYQW